MTKSYAALLLIPLAGCISFGAKPPKALLTLNPATTVTVGATRNAAPGQSITILYASAPVAIAAPRVPVYSGGIAIAYVKDAAWVESPVRLFQRLLSETVAAKTGKIVLDLRQYTADPGLRLQGDLSMFGIDGDTNEAVVTYDAIITRPTGVETRRFQSRVPVGVIDATTVGPALNQAANNVAAEIAVWIGTG